MTFGFKELPEIVLDYQIFVGTSEGAKINIGVLLPIKSIMHRVLNEKFTHPNCRCIGLEMGSLERNAIQVYNFVPILIYCSIVLYIIIPG